MGELIPGICTNMQQKNNVPVLNYNIPRWKVVDWVGLIGSNIIIGPYLYNQHTYLHMINQYVVPKLVAKYGQGCNGPLRRLWWVQDGAPAHRAFIVQQ